MDPIAVEWDREYQYRRAFGLTHDQYLDEPAEAVEWLLNIDAVRREIRERRRTAEED